MEGLRRKTHAEWSARIARGELPIVKGYLLDEEDLVLRRHILNLMTQFETNLESASLPHLAQVPQKLSEMQRDGLVTLSGSSVQVTEQGKAFVRNVCMALDARLARQVPDRPLFSRTV